MSLCVLAQGLLSQQRAESSQPVPAADTLNVTMQIIMNPDAKQPDEVIRRIQPPARESTTPATPASGQDAKDRARETKNLRQSARERALEAAERSEQARRAAAESRIARKRQ